MAGDNVRNVQKLQALCESDDDRVAVIALKEWFERLYGRAGETGFAADEGATMHDLSNISHDDRLRLSEAFTTIRDILGIGPGGLPGLVIEG